MIKEMTPCEKLGYKVGDRFEVTEDSVYFKKGDIAHLSTVDNSSCPFFINEKVVRDGYSEGCAMYLYSVNKISKLKPAKQALADAIHQNGGWPNDARWTLATSNGLGHVFCWTDKPHRDTWNWTGGTRCISIAALGRIIQNWHQTILSRDEYFTAYPEQKVESEMKSESEMTIKVSDWHKNGELPPVGNVVEVYSDRPHHRYEHHVGLSVRIVAHDGDVAVYFAESIQEYYALVARCFRPLRTERDKAIDEMSVCMGIPETGRKFSALLYDAGYRKEDK